MSLKAIAKELGISVTTVSRALNGYSDVAESTRQLIVKTAKAQGYSPDASARRLKTGRGNTVGLVYPMVTTALYDPNLLDIVANITKAFARHNIDTVMVSDQEHDGQFPYIRLLESGKVDALIVMDVLKQDPRIQYLQSRNHKFLSFGRTESQQPYAWIDFDCELGSRKAVNYLIQKGHSKIGFLGGDDDSAFIHQRREGYIAQMHDSKLDIPEEYIVQLPRNRRNGFVGMYHILSLQNRPSAVLIDSSMLADGAMMAIEQAGLKPGIDISLIAYDGLPPDTISTCEMASIRLSTSEKQSEQIAEMTIALLKGDSPEHLNELWIPEIMEGTSVQNLN